MTTYHVLLAYQDNQANFNGDCFNFTVETDNGYNDAILKTRAAMAAENEWTHGEERDLRVIMVVRGGELC